MLANYGGTFKTTLEKLQKKAMRYISAANSRDQIEPLFSETEPLTLTGLYTRSVLKITYFRIPDVSARSHQNSTRFRTAENLSIPNIKYECSRRGSAAKFIRIFNALPSSYKTLIIEQRIENGREIVENIKEIC